MIVDEDIFSCKFLEQLPLNRVVHSTQNKQQGGG